MLVRHSLPGISPEFSSLVIALESKQGHTHIPRISGIQAPSEDMLEAKCLSQNGRSPFRSQHMHFLFRTIHLQFGFCKLSCGNGMNVKSQVTTGRMSQFRRLMGIPAEKISILSTYNGQKVACQSRMKPFL